MGDAGELIRQRIQQLVDGAEIREVEHLFAAIDRALILSRVQRYDAGEVGASDWRESLTRVEERFNQERPPLIVEES